MTNLELRVLRLEGELREANNAITQLQTQLGQIAQNQYAAGQPTYASTGTFNILFCILGGSLALSGAPPSGTPTKLTNQTVYAITGGAFSSISTTATVYNGMPDAIASGAAVILAGNPDGTYSVVAVAC
jgi:hypothetical protein